MTYSVRAIDPGGARREFERDAANAEALAASLRSEGYLVLSATPTANARADGATATGRKRKQIFALPVTMFDIEMGLRQTAAMLRSGVPLLAALETVAEQSRGARARECWQRTAGKVLAGESFAAALRSERRTFSDITVQLAEVGERSGELEHTLSRAADQLEARRTLSTAVANALVYPVMTVALAVAVSAYLIVGVIPKLSEFLRSAGATLPPVTQALIDVSDWTISNGITLVCAIAAAVACWLALRLTELGREAEDVILLHTPVVGRILRLSGTSLFARAMQIMLESGVMLTSALQTASQLIANRRLRRRITTAAERVVGGTLLSASLADAREFMPMLRRMTAVGEVTGALPEAFGETARFHEMLLAVAVKRLGMLIEPVMILITGLIVGFVYVAFFMALFAIAGAG